MKRFFRSPWFWLGVVALIGLIIWFFIPAYCFGGVFLWGVEAVVGVYLLLRRLSGKHPKAARRLRRAFTVCVALGLMAMSFTAGLIAQAGHGSRRYRVRFSSSPAPQCMASSPPWRCRSG